MNKLPETGETMYRLQPIAPENGEITPIIPAENGTVKSIFLALLSSFFIILSFPSPDLGILAWIALVPLLLACRGRSPAFSFFLGLLFGTATTVGTFFWIFQVPGFKVYHLIPATLYLALYPALWTSVLAFLRQKGSSCFLFAPALWIAFDYVKAHAGFLSLPWATLAHSQHNNLAGIQLAAITGEYGVTFLIVLGNMAVFEMLFLQAIRKGILVLTLILLVHLGGILELSTQNSGPSVKIAIVQPAILISERKSATGRESSLVRLERISLQAALAHPSLIVWPETSVRALNMDTALYERLRRLSEALKTPLLVGASDFSKVLLKKESSTDKRYSFNSAYFLTPGSPPGEPYRKHLLVPFGEYLPLRPVFRWPEWFVTDIVETRPGTDLNPFTLPNGVRFSTMICWENLFPGYVRELANTKSKLIVQLTNDAWFGKTAAPRQHNLASVLRSVENHIPIVLASNTGPSQCIDRSGRILTELPTLYQPGTTSADLALKSDTTFYSRFGDLFAFAAIAFTISGVFPRFRKKSGEGDSDSRKETPG